MPKDLLKKIEDNYKKFSKGQKLIGAFIIKQYDKAAFMTASKLGKAVGVSESTVVRFATELGYDGYPSLQKALQELIKTKLTSVQRIEVANEKIAKSGVLRGVMLSDIDKIRATMEKTSEDNFEKAVETLINAKKIYILGVRSSSALASFMGFYFNLIFDNVKLVQTTSASEIYEQIHRIEKGDVMIGISFPRYSKRTIRAMEYSLDNGADVIAITDSEESPLIKCSNNHLTASSDMVSFVDSLVGPLSLINALIAAIGVRKQDEISATFHKLERMWEEYDVYQKND
ncbi:MAG: MurR/RpiR family transcriptional regulator [Clostridia bacterium]|nr:MurR/RpiR family transcriptional regulator [Clostridia bacterium]